MLDKWFENDGANLRSWLVARTPDLLHGIVEHAPLWVVGLVAAVVLLAGIWAVVQLVESALRATGLLARAASDPVGAARDMVAPDAKKYEVDAVSAEVSHNRNLIIEMKAQLDRLEQLRVAEGAKPLSADERLRRDQAAFAIAGEQTPASDAASAQIAAGNLEDAIATLERDARADAEASAEKWRRIGALARGVSTVRARNAYERAASLQPEDFSTWHELAILRQEAGDLPGALQAAGAAEKVAKSDRERMIAYALHADGLWERGDQSEAASAYRRAMDLADRLTRENPNSETDQRICLVLHLRSGHVAMSAGDLDGAKMHFDRAEAIAARLSALAPDSEEAAHNLLACEVELAGLARIRGDTAAAKSRHEQAVAAAQRLQKRYPDSTTAACDLADCLERLGDILLQEDDVAGAKRCLLQVFDVRERLARNNPGSAILQDRLANAHERLGEILVEEQNFADARRRFEQACNIRDRVARNSPESAKAQMVLAQSLTKLGDGLEATGEPDAAVASYERARAIITELARKFPDTQEYRDELIFIDEALTEIRAHR